jgi:hypothetical protein
VLLSWCEQEEACACIKKRHGARCTHGCMRRGIGRRTATRRKAHRSKCTLRKPTGSIEKAALDWNPQGARGRGRPKKTWKRAVEEEAIELGKAWREVKRIAVDRIRWKRFTDALCSRGSNRN